MGDTPSLADRLDMRANTAMLCFRYEERPEYAMGDFDLDHDAATELRELTAWKSSAMKVLAEWDEVFEALGRPGKLGESKAVSSLAEVERLIAAGLRTAALADDATRQEVEALCASLLDAGSDERICNAVDRARELLSAAYLGRTD